MTNLEKLRAGLRRHYGAVSEISRRTGKSYQHVRSVLAGTRQNLDVLSVAATVYEERERDSQTKRATIEETMRRVEGALAQA